MIPRIRRDHAFTLLEMMLSVAVFVILVTSAFSLVGATTELMSEVSEVQNEAAERMRFLETCRVAFESMTGKSALEFYYFDLVLDIKIHSLIHRQKGCKPCY
jgi:prepilin-type N-terminal cleavage/methylation domain-containing protein